MLIGKVIGRVVSTQKDEKIEGLKFLIVQNLDTNMKLTGNFVVAVDSVGAGTDEVVLYASGSSARQTEETANKPVDAVIMAIVDTCEINSKIKYSKT
jgi:microcompartment protein CcmK/EutM